MKWGGHTLYLSMFTMYPSSTPMYLSTYVPWIPMFPDTMLIMFSSFVLKDI